MASTRDGQGKQETMGYQGYGYGDRSSTDQRTNPSIGASGPLATPLRPLVDLVAGIQASVHAKLFSGFLIGSFLMLGLVILSVVIVGRMSQRVDDLIRLGEEVDRARQMEYLVTAQSHFRAMELLTNVDFYNASISLAKKEFLEHLDEVEGMNRSENGEFFHGVRKSNDRFAVASDRVEALYQAGNIDQALKLHIDEEHEVSHELEDAMGALIAGSSADIAQASTAFQADQRFLTNVLWIFSGVSLVAALLLGFVVSWAFIRPVRQINSVLAAIAGGDFAQRVEVPNQDEFGTLSRNVNEMSEQLAGLYYQAEQLAAVQERNRLARDLHDSVTQTMFSITLTTEATRILLQRDPARVAPYLDRLQELAQEAGFAMRSLIRQLHPSPVVGEGLAVALRNHFSSLKNSGGLVVSLDIRGEGRLSSDQEEALFRIVQEALNNVIKHAQVKEATVTLCIVDERVSLTIEDHGVGFDPGPSETGRGGFGFGSMRERAEMLGGTLEIRSSLGGGTRVLVEVPYTNGGESNR